ncbi:phage tail protein [Xenorhabdus budapestensis]|uniref:Phage tail protein n=1 Tax=Xenorhabdus budapestensis TaxID=290110 RepID=A0ABX7VK60_XENBU|nr:phage tail protein [Xenorhabdus budapestensis]QTL39154.1 phage tail protein [Xenorhabdus budapestensis]
MSTKYFALLTQLGADKLANAAALGTKIEITHMAVGDGGGSLPTPDTKQTKLINEKRRAAINTLSIDPKNTNQIVAEQVIPENEGGWWIREIGLYDKDGILIAVGNCAETYKPQLQEGSGRTQTIRMILIVSSADAVTLKVDPSVILATREYVDDSIKKHENSRTHPDATLKEKGFAILSSAVDSNSETHAATPKSVKAAYDLANAADNNANGRVPSGRKVNGKALSADISLNSADVGAYSKEETEAKVREAKAQADAANNNANTRLEKNKNGADIPNKDEFVKNLGLTETVGMAKNAVPTSRKINGKSLGEDVTLNAQDVQGEPRFNMTIDLTGLSTDRYYPVWWRFPSNDGANPWLTIHRWYAEDREKDLFSKGEVHIAGLLLQIEGGDVPWGGDAKYLNIKRIHQRYRKTVKNICYGMMSIARPIDGKYPLYEKVKSGDIVYCKRFSGCYLRGGLTYHVTSNFSDIHYSRKDDEVEISSALEPQSNFEMKWVVKSYAIDDPLLGKDYDDTVLPYAHDYAETINLAKNAVPNSRKINGKPLTNDINLNAGEIGAVSASGGVYNQSFDFKTINTENFYLKYDEGKHNYISWYEGAGRSAYLGFPSDNAKYFNIANEKLNSILTLHADSVTHNSRKLAYQDDNYTKSESDTKYQMLGLTQTVSEYNVPWNANSGLYNANFLTHTKMIVNFNMGVGSCPTLQLLANYRNGGLFYRSARDAYGFEENWAELLTVESANSRYIQDIRLGSVENARLWRGYGYSDTPPYVITGIINHNADDVPDNVERRPFQKLVNGTWYNIGTI